MTQPVDLSFDCEVCGLEGGAVETYDPQVASCRFGVPARTRCRMCKHETRGAVRNRDGHLYNDFDAKAPANMCPGCGGDLGPDAVDAKRCPHCGSHAQLDLVLAGKKPTSIDELMRVLGPWAADDGYPDITDFLQATFVTPSADAMLGALSRGERVETVPDPFDRQGGGRGSATASAKVAPVDAVRIEPKRERETAPESAPPRAVLYPLVSVIAADGEIDPRERALVDRFLVSEGLAPLQDDEIRVHPPGEAAHLIAPARRQAVVQLMCETASIDGAADAAEIRVIRAYAGAWGVDDEQVDLWLWAHQNIAEPFARQMWKKIRRFVLSSRWEAGR